MLKYFGGVSMKLNDDIRNKINFYYSNPEEYDFLSGLLNNPDQLQAFLRPKIPNQLDRKQKKDRMLMMKIVYSLQKLTKKKEIMGAGLSEEVMTPKAFRIGSRLFNLCSEIVLGVLVSFLISIVVMIYFNIYFGLILVPVLGYGTFYFLKQYVVENMDKKVLELGNEQLKQDKNRYL
jgi:hypothetical protein